MTGAVPLSSRPADQAARDAIRDDHDRTLFVEAGAGAGKTTALVARVVEMTASGHLAEMGRLAAITFTENAAAELRNRIREALERAAAGTGHVPAYGAKGADRCAAALRQLDDAAISTLHGFAARILADFPLEAGLPPGFTVRDAITSQLDAGRSWRTFLDGLFDDDTVTGHVLAGLTLELGLDQLRAVEAAFAANWDLLLDRPFIDTPLPPIDVTAILAPLRRAASVADGGPEGDRLTQLLRLTVRPVLSELTSLTDPWDLLDAVHRLPRFPTTVGSRPAWGRAGLSKEDVVDALQEANQARDDLLAAVGHAVTATLCARLQEHVLAAAERRRQGGQLDFHDLLVLTRDVLRSAPEVRRRLHERFTTVLIDEFQDTDPLQVEIAHLIGGDVADDPPEDWSAIPVRPGRLFFVGDPTQSIYRFRRADVGLFTEVGDRHSGGHVRLDVNFRSVPGIIAAVNAVFTELIGAADGQAPYALLQPSRPPGTGGPPVRLLGGPLDDGAVELREREAAHVAAAIRRVKAEQWQITPGDGPRAASYQDVAVLLPTRTSLPALEQALQDRDIPYRVESRSLVWATDTVRDLVTLLQAVSNPADEVATVAALRHPGLACSDVDLLSWAEAGGGWNYLSPPPDDVPAGHPVAAARTTLRRWHDLRWWLPVNQLLDRIITELRLVELTTELRRPRDHWRRLRFLLDQARAFCDAGGTGLADFVAWAVEQIESDADVLESVVPEPDDDAVRILTVHGSKGLEFPVTVLVGLGSPPRTRTSVLWAGDRPEVRLKGDHLRTAGYTTGSEVEKTLDRAEKVRLLYVAMTRATDHLLIGCYHKPVRSGSGSHAQRVWQLLATSPLVTVEDSPPYVPAAPTRPSGRPAALPLERNAFLTARTELLTEVRGRVATSATATLGEVEAGVPSSADEPPADVPPSSEGDGGTDEPVRRRPARSGAALGSAVHRVLELVDLTAADEAEVGRLAVMACAEQDILPLTGEVTARVRHALAADIVTTASRGRHWREVYVVAPVGPRFVEGYVDLLVDTPDGPVIVDYKTDRIGSHAELADRAAHYRPQLQAYAHALAPALGRTPRRGILVFLGREQARQVVVDLNDSESP